MCFGVRPHEAVNHMTVIGVSLSDLTSLSLQLAASCWGKHEQAPPSGVAEQNVRTYHTSCRKSVTAPILRILASCINSKMIHYPQRWDHA